MLKRVAGPDDAASAAVMSFVSRFGMGRIRYKVSQNRRSSVPQLQRCLASCLLRPPISCGGWLRFPSSRPFERPTLFGRVADSPPAGRA